MTHPRRPRSPNGTRLEVEPVRSYRLDDANYQALERRALAEPYPRTMSDITRALIEAWTDGEITLTLIVRRRRSPDGTSTAGPCRSYRLGEDDWQAFKARCAEHGLTMTAATLSLLVMWHRGLVEIEWLGDSVQVAS